MSFENTLRELYDWPAEELADLVGVLSEYLDTCSECGQSNGWASSDKQDRESAGLNCFECESGE